MNLFKNRTILGILCIVLSLGICFGVTPLFNNAISAKTSIVRVKSTINQGEQITSNMLETVEVGAYNLPSNIVIDENLIVGAYALADFYKGDYILSSKINATKQAENAYLYNLDGTKQAMSISIQSFATGLSGKLESGDIISIICANFGIFEETVIPAELKYVEVITVTGSSGTDTQNQQADDEEKELPSTVTVLVTEEQSKILADLEANGDIHISLVYRGSVENCDKFIEAQDTFLQELYYPETDEESEEIDEEPAETDEELAEIDTTIEVEKVEIETAEEELNEETEVD